MFVLHGSPHSQFTYKVALMLRLSSAPFAFRYVSFRAGMHRTAAFRALSRYGEVPVLEFRGSVLVQSGALLEFLAEELGTFAGTSRDRQAIREWLFWDADRLSRPVYDCYGLRLREQGLLPFELDPPVEARQRASAEAALAQLDSGLTTRPHLTDSGLTIADLGCYGDYAFAALSGLKVSSHPNVCRWAAEIERLPAFSAPLDLLPMGDAEFA
jgi:glutathione S-transferase